MEGVDCLFFLKKYLNCYILTEINYDIGKFNTFTELKKHRKSKLIDNEERKLSNNLIRARQKIFDYAFNNNFNYFITLTISSIYDRTDYLSFINKFYCVVRDMREKYGATIEYLLVPEFHKDGVNVHFHGLLYCDNIESEIYLNNNGFYSIRSLDKLGFNSISPIKDNFNVSCYITKYVTKNKMNVAKKSKHSYFKSKGLKLPESYQIKEVGRIDNWDFQNDYCRKKKLPLDFNITF